MTEPIQHGGEWWTRAVDGSWLKWNAAEYTWDPQPGSPPFPVEPPPPAAPPGETVVAVEAPPATAPEADTIERRLRDFDPVDGKARAAQVLVGMIAAASLVSGLMLFRTLARDAVFEDNPVLAGISTFGLYGLLASGIAMIVWLKGAYDNAPALGASALRYTPGWAIGAWFIPVGNLFIPKQIADDVWRTSDPALPPHAGAQWMFKPVPAMMHVWWAAWLAQGVLGFAASALNQTAIMQQDISDYRMALGLEGANDFLIVLSGILLIKIISEVTERQRERAQMLRAQSEEAAPPPG